MYDEVAWLIRWIMEEERGSKQKLRACAAVFAGCVLVLGILASGIKFLSAQGARIERERERE